MKFLFLLAVITVCCPQSYAGSAIDALNQIDASALLVVDGNGKTLYSKHAEQMLVPASTIKVLTALMALEHWGRNHRFATEFYFNRKTNILSVKGLGDPFLVSEEIDIIVEKIKELGIQSLEGIQVDISYFSEGINSDHQVISGNPYDALASALSANFNTIAVNVSGNSVTSGEIQTPITHMAKSLAKGLPNGKHRINLGKAQRGPRYFVEVLTEKLRLAGVQVNHTQAIESEALELALLFTHYNSRTLDQVVTAMLEYSNNFIANQLFLMLGAEKFTAPATLDKSREMLKAFVAKQFNWQQYEIHDGAGLSRKNQLSARQLAEIAKQFATYRDLMPIQKRQILAKSGTLSGVSCYVGYVFRGDTWLTFALMINQPVEYRFRERLAEELLTLEF
ncbi:MAG: D-alanyl-D-alanine carboxypeptidase [Gammaproteobacteria bacterium]|nr:D-alanyl-D-alanine carboxypeptidase [Gammaproteobacteria bacterium]